MNNRYEVLSFKDQIAQADEKLEKPLNYLNFVFRDVCEKYKHSNISTPEQREKDVKNWQKDYSYIVNDLQTGPIFLIPQNISIANTLVDKISAKLHASNSSGQVQSS